MSMLKYGFTDETIKFDGKVLHRIRASTDFGDVKEGDLGGFIEKEENLESFKFKGDSWVYPGSKVFGNASVVADGKVKGNSTICDNAVVGGSAVVLDSKVYGHARVISSANLENSVASGYSYISGKATISNSNLRDYFRVGGTSKLQNKTFQGYTEIFDDKIIKLNQGCIVNLNSDINETLMYVNKVDEKNFKFEAYRVISPYEPLIFSKNLDLAKSLDLSTKYNLSFSNIDRVKDVVENKSFKMKVDKTLNFKRKNAAHHEMAEIEL